jgi:hypothetical protein
MFGDACNATKPSTAPVDRDHELAKRDTSCACLYGDRCHRQEAEPLEAETLNRGKPHLHRPEKPTRLDFAVIGAQKAASTWVTAILGDHPDIWIPSGELPCFENRYPDSDPLGRLPHPPGGAVIRGVKNNNLMYRPESPGLLRRHFPDIKLIASLRDPVDRLISSYYWQLWVGYLPPEPPAIGLERVLETNDQELLAPGFYARHLRRFLDHFDREQILTFLVEDIRSDGLDVARRVYTFLGARADFRPGHLTSRPKTTVHSLARVRWNTLRNPFILRRDEGHGSRILWKPDQSAIDRTVSAVVAGVDRFLLAHVLPNRRPSLPRTLLRRIADVYADDVQHLQTVIQRDLSAWPTLRILRDV